MVLGMPFQSVVGLGAELFDRACREGIEARSQAPLVWVESSASHELGWLEQVAQNDRGEPICDALLVGLRVEVGAELLRRLPCLRYLGLFGSNLSPIDLKACAARDIEVRRVLGYCDPETAQWCIAAALQVARGMGKVALADAPRSIAALTWGIIGLGSVGHELFSLASALGVSCQSVRRPSYPEEIEGLRWCSPEELRSSSRILSLHVPPHTRVWEPQDIAELRDDAMVIDTCIGQAYDDEAMRAFLDRGGTVVLDSLSSAYHPALLGHPRVYAYSMRAHATAESDQRRREIFWGHMDTFLATTETDRLE